jgi:hypothetical protein
MKKTCVALGIMMLALLVASPVFAAMGHFVGKWNNTDANTRGITELDIAMSGNALNVHAWGQCHPKDCDWGVVPGYAYAHDVSANLVTNATAVTALYKTGFSETILVIHSNGAQLRADVFTRFTDNSNRSNYTASYMFSKAPVTPALTAPVQVSPTNGSVFNIFPRTTKVDWNPVPGAASYTVEVDCMSCCQAGKWCTDVGKQYQTVPNIQATDYTFNFVGAQPGRWRVWAVGANGQQGPKSPWWGFTYTR